jgi:catechol 2,3-dioxygenase
MHGSLGTGLTPRSTMERIASETAMGTVRLTVSELSRSTRFYEQVLGLRAIDGEDGSVGLTAGADRVLVELRGDSSAAPRNPGAPGLFHLAILMPDRAALAMALARLGAARWPLSGASDHLVSEALYLDDPDGNGIEIYRDRPRQEWTSRDGMLEMATIPLDLQNLLSELNGVADVDPLAPTGTTMGHVHLQVSDLAEAEAFYAGVLGFEVTVRAYPGALFVSAGGYHHHIGLNTWHSRGAAPGPPGAVGLRSFEVLLPTPDELETVLARVRGAGLDSEPAGDGHLVHDPSGNGVLLRTA